MQLARIHQGCVQCPVFCRSCLFLLLSAMERKSRGMSSLKQEKQALQLHCRDWELLYLHYPKEQWNWRLSGVEAKQQWHCTAAQTPEDSIIAREERLSVFLAPAYGQLGFWLQVRKARKTEESTCLQKGEPQAPSAYLAAPHFQVLFQ